MMWMLPQSRRTGGRTVVHLGWVAGAQRSQRGAIVREDGKSGRRWVLQFQSAYVLPLARGIYLLIALACLAAVVGGIGYAIYLQVSVGDPPSLVEVPPPYQGSGPVGQMTDSAVDLGLVQSRLEPPTNIRFVVTVGTLSEPPSVGQVLGHFAADTRNGLAPFPDGVSLLGGPDAEFFERVRDGSGKRIAFAARPSLIDELGDALRDIERPTDRVFTIRVVARDRYGVASVPTDISFTLALGPKPTSAAPPSAPERQPTELEVIAREIARAVEPEVNPAHFAVYNAALKVPGRCGTTDSDQTFLANYRRVVEEMRPRLTAANVDAVYLGLCEAWKSALEREAAAREEAEQRQRAAQRSADEARARAIAHNNELRQRHESRIAEVKAQTMQTLTLIGGAFALFLSVALVLAFLAIEGHSRAVRAAMEAMVRLSEDRQPKTPEGEAS